MRTMSFTSGPPADPAGNDIIAFMMSSDVRSTELQESSDGVGNAADMGCGGGCFCLRSSMVLSLFGAKVSLLLTILTAPRTSPSSNLAATQAAKFFSGSFGGLKVVGLGSLSSFTALMTELARLRL